VEEEPSKTSEPKAYTCTDGCQPKNPNPTVTWTCNECKALASEGEKDAEAVCAMLDHLVHSEHGEALRRVGTCIRGRGDTWHLLNKLFAKGVN